LCILANEEEVGRAIRDSGVKRKDVYVTTKLNNQSHHRVHAAFEESLSKLGVEYIDMYLMHWPQASVDGKDVCPMIQSGC
jgi:glycerol 2-dehydrogenase (NADP+)